LCHPVDNGFQDKGNKKRYQKGHQERQRIFQHGVGQPEDDAVKQDPDDKGPHLFDLQAPTSMSGCAARAGDWAP